MRLVTLLGNSIQCELEKRNMERAELDAGLVVGRGWGGDRVTSEMLDIEIALLKDIRKKVEMLDADVDNWLDGVKSFCHKAENSKFRLRRKMSEIPEEERSPADNLKRAYLHGEEDAYRRIRDELAVLTNY